MRAQVEVLAPAGSMESMKAAIHAGADAVYMGGSRFGARAYAENPEEDRFLEAIDYAHLHGRRLYMTVNTLVKESEIGQMVDFLLPYYERGLDAVIVQDMGVLSLIRQEFPDLPVHASTQMTVTNWRSAAFLREQGVKRVVTARELSLDEIAAIREHTDMEIESFVHGALCYCYSGQCLMSSLIGGRSGNRGRCAQPCRLPFEVTADRHGRRANAKAGRREKPEPYLLSMKDLCTLDILPEIIEAGVYSLKIEGRMKSPRYTAGVVSVYRKYVDLYLKRGRAGYRVDAADRKLLLDLFDRGGQTDGYYQRHNGRDMVVRKEKPAFRETNPALLERLDREYVNAKQQEPVCGRVTVAEGEPLCLELSAAAPQRCLEAVQGDTAEQPVAPVSVRVTGESVLTAQNQPLTEEKLVRQMKKTGNSPFFLKDLEAEIRGNCFVSVQALNELRRRGLDALQEEILRPYRRTPHGPHAECRTAALTGASAAGIMEDGISAPHRSVGMADRSQRLHVSLEEASGLQAVLEAPEVDEVYLDSNGFGAEIWADAVRQCHRAGKDCALILPNVFRVEAEDYLSGHMEELHAACFDEFVVRSLEEILFLREQGIAMDRVVPDANLYAMNHLAAEWFAHLGVARLTLPLEENERELEELVASACAKNVSMEDVPCFAAPGGWEMLVYGYLPAMVSAQCIMRTTEGCTRKPALLFLKDRTGKELPVKNHCRFCYNVIYNPTPLSLLGMEQSVRRIGPSVIRLSFTVETPEQIRAVIAAYVQHFRYGGEGPAPYREYTRGHMKRGAE